MTNDELDRAMTIQALQRLQQSQGLGKVTAPTEEEIKNAGNQFKDWKKGELNNESKT